MSKVVYLNGAVYLNCEQFTDDEMTVIAHWQEATKEQKQSVRDKGKWRDTRLFRVEKT